MTNFVIVRCPILNYKDSQKTVYAFIQKRIEAFVGEFSITYSDENNVISTVGALQNGSDHIAVIDGACPLIDFDLLGNMRDVLSRSDAKICMPTGAVPGTEVRYLCSPGVFDISANIGAAVRVHSDTQSLYNMNLNLKKYKRVKMFLFLRKRITGLHALSVPAIVDKMNDDEIFARCAAYGEDVNMLTHDRCPHCIIAGGGERIRPLVSDASHPFIGYVPNRQPVYYICDDCGLVFLSPYADADSAHKLYDEYYEKDYDIATSVNFSEDASRCDFSEFIHLLPDVTRTVDLGGGTGTFSKFIKKKYPRWDVTHSDFSIPLREELESADIKTMAVDFAKETLGADRFDLITCFEVLEHLSYQSFEYAIKNIYTALKRDGIFVFSTPDFDSPLTKIFDHYAVDIPFHILCFSKTWLLNYFKTRNLFRIISVRNSPGILGSIDGWCDYYKSTSRTDEYRSGAQLLGLLLAGESEISRQNRQFLTREGLGTHMVVTLQK